MAFGATRDRKTWSNAKLNIRENALIGLRIISDFVNWISVMQAFDG